MLDTEVSALAQKLIVQLDADFDADVVEKKFPIKYLEPLNNIVNRELDSFRSLMKAIRDSVADLIANIDGTFPRPFEIEALWGKIQCNKVPDKWLKYSFETAVTSLADFIVEVGLKLEFWREVVDSEKGLASIRSIWLPAFYDPRSFLMALKQTRARYERIPMNALFNEYSPMDEYEVTIAPEDRGKNVMYIHGLHLEGADWDANKLAIVEITDRRRFVPFPAFMVFTKKKTERYTPHIRPLNFAITKKGQDEHEAKLEAMAADDELE